MALDSNNQAIARQLLASALQIETAEIPDNATIGQLESWDSLAHARLIMALEQQLDASLSPDVVVSIESLEDVIKILENSN